MIISILPFGNHTNQIYLFIQGYFFAKEHGTEFIYLSMNKLFPFFPIFSNQFKSFKTSFVYPVLSFILHCLYKVKLINVLDLLKEEDCKKLLSIVNSKKIIYVRNWTYDNNQYLYNSVDLEKKYLNEISKFFYHDISKIENQYFPSDSSKTIGLHIRRGDYKTHNNGAYFYSDEILINTVKSVVKLFRIKSYSVIIFTNDPDLDKQKYINSLSHVVFSKEQFYIDYQLMAKCNYLVGPPSSFTMFTSLLGQVPTYHIYDSNHKVQKKDFIIFNGFKESI